jgi:hypothetical protein
MNARISESIVVISFPFLSQEVILHDQGLQVKKDHDFSLLAAINKSFCGCFTGPDASRGGFLEKSPPGIRKKIRERRLNKKIWG